MRLDDLVRRVRSRQPHPAQTDPAAQLEDPDVVLDAAFARLAASFEPARAEGTGGSFQFEVATADGMRPYAVEVVGGRCMAGRGHRPADVVIGIALRDLLRLVDGSLTGRRAFISGKLALRGNPTFAVKLGDWFAPR